VPGVGLEAGHQARVMRACTAFHLVNGGVIGISRVVPESGVKIAILDLDRFQLLNLSQDVIREIL